jgi:archaellum component FlaC
MVNPAWDNGTTDEKLELLRDDVRRLFDVVNALSSDTQHLLDLVRQTESKLTEVAKAVEVLEGRSAKAKKKKSP